MNYNEIIEAEIKKQVEERTKEIEISYEKKFEDFKQTIVDEFFTKIYMKFKSNFIDNFDQYKEEFIKDIKEIENKEFVKDQDFIDNYFGKTKKDSKTSKCDYIECKNYRDGILDDICATCDSRIIKEEKTKECNKNLENSCATKVKETLNKVKKDNDQEDNITDVNKVFDMFGNFLEDFGITKEQLKNAKVKIFSNDEAIGELKKIFSDFGYNDLF